MRQQDKKQIPFRLDEETRTKLKVKVIDVDNAGKIKLSHKEFTPKAEKKETSKEVKEETKKKSSFRKKSN